MSDTELDITSLLARISQLEERQNIVSKYVVGLKRQFDGMIDAVVEEQSPTAFNDEEFKTERIMWLLNRIYAAEEESHETPISAEEFLKRYNAGERDFTGINLAGENLSGESLNNSLNLSGANLRGAELCELNLSTADSKVKLVEAIFEWVQLTMPKRVVGD